MLNNKNMLLIRHIFLMAFLLFHIQPVLSAPDDCSLANVDCRGPIVFPFRYQNFYSGGYVNAPYSAQGAAEKACSEFFLPYGSCVCGDGRCQYECEVNYLAPFQDGSYEGNGCRDDYSLCWKFGIETGQIIDEDVPGVEWKLSCNNQYIKIFRSTNERGRDVRCPIGYYPNIYTQPFYDYCYNPGLIADRTCKVGNPIFIGGGNKQQIESDYKSKTLRFTRTYNSNAVDEATGVTIGAHWRHNYDRYISTPSNAADVSGSAYALRQNGDTEHFVLDNGAVVEATMTTDRLERDGSGWRYTTGSDEVELYNDTGRLVSITNRAGQTQTLTYDSTGRLTQVADDAGRTLTFIYNSDNRIVTMTAPDGGLYSYEYDTNGRLSKVIYPDDTPGDMSDNPARTYHYENTLSVNVNALTGITDENGNRYATWEYDTQGRAISSEHAGGVDRTEFTFNADGSTTVTNALGKQTTYHFEDINGYRYVASVEGHQTTYCAGANKVYSRDSNGYLLSKTDWNGNVTNYTRDSRGLELSRTEAAGTPQERTITTEWHSEFRLPLKIIEPGKITEYTYDAQGRQLSKTTRSR